MKKLTGNLFKMGLLALLTILTSVQTQAAALSYTVLDSSLIRVSTPTNLVIRKRTDWQNFYMAATSHIFPQPAIPLVDFSKVTVVVVASGERSTGGYKTLISGATEILASTTVPTSYIDVQSVLINPGSGCFVSMSFTYPVALFTVKSTTKPFVFNTGNVYKNCI